MLLSVFNICFSIKCLISSLCFKSCRSLASISKDLAFSASLCNGAINSTAVTVIYNQPIPGVTGGALDSNEGEPGPIMMQGDHGPIEYRNIIITPAITK